MGVAVSSLNVSLGDEGSLFCTFWEARELFEQIEPICNSNLISPFVLEVRVGRRVVWLSRNQIYYAFDELRGLLDPCFKPKTRNIFVLRRSAAPLVKSED